jgi:hypothetical protein
LGDSWGKTGALGPKIEENRAMLAENSLILKAGIAAGGGLAGKTGCRQGNLLMPLYLLGLAGWYNCQTWYYTGHIFLYRPV